MIFAFIGYILYIVLCGYLTLMSVVVWAFTQRVDAELVVLWCIVAAAWYGAYAWWPFNPITLAS